MKKKLDQINDQLLINSWSKPPLKFLLWEYIWDINQLTKEEQMEKILDGYGDYLGDLHRQLSPFNDYEKTQIINNGAIDGIKLT